METNTSQGLSLAERGRDASGAAITVDRRLFVQLYVFTHCAHPDKVADAFRETQFPGAVYASQLDPHGVGVASFSEDENWLADTFLPWVRTSPLAGCTPLPKMSMLGRTYAIGHETDLEHRLITRPAQTIANPAWPWAVWYPLRRAGAFELLPAAEQRTILAEHGGIGHAYGRADYAHDLRLSCHGLSEDDNDFITGLFGKRLHPLSAVVQHMRKTQQTARYLTQLGPFFVGKALAQTLTPDYA